MTFRIYERILIAENKWRAVRYGMDGKLIDFGTEQETPVGDLIRELLERVDPLVDKLGSRNEIEHIYTMLDQGSCADQQLRVWQESGEDTKAVVDFLIAETERFL
jgi:glutamate---cysteine ligase / carboxylate-amine ligase